MSVSTVPTDREEFARWLRSALPRLLREDPSFYSEVVGLLVQALGSRSDLDRLLEESKALREQAERALHESRIHFEAAERRFEELVEQLRASDRRFEEMRRSQDEALERLKENDRRFEEMGRRHDEVLARLKENDARFEEVFQHLRENDRRFEEMGRRHDEVLARLKENDRRFEEMFQRLEANERHVARLWLGLGSLGVRVGRGLEAVIRDVIADFSGVDDLEPRKLVLTDAAGEVYEPGSEVEIDAYVYDGRRFLVEVKSYAKPGDASAFARKASFAERELGITAERVLIALAAAPGTRERAIKLGIRLVTYGRR